MADNVTLPGTGQVAATDDNGTAHEQVIKLDLGANSTFTGYVGGESVGSSAFGMYVVPRGDADQQTQDSASLTTASTSYAIGDTLGSGWTFTSFARAAGAGGFITGAVLTDYADVISTVDVYLYSDSVSFGTDNSAPSIADSSLQIGKLTFSPDDMGTHRVATIDSIALPYYCVATSLYAYAITRSAHTFFGAATDLKLRLFRTRF